MEERPQIYQKDAYPTNSKTQKLEEKRERIEKVATGKVQKRSLTKRFRDSFIANDGRSVGEYVFWDILVPSAKELLNELGRGALEMFLFGEKRGGRTRRDGATSYVSYEAFHRNARANTVDARRPEMSRAARSRHDFDEIVLSTRGEGETVLSSLVDLIMDYGQATVADLYDLAGLETSYTDQHYGWTDLRDASVHRTRNGYILNLPKPISLK